MKNNKTFYYTDELNDEFEPSSLKPRMIDEKFKYSKNFLWNFCSFIIQNVLSMPIKLGYAKIKFNHKFVGKEKLKQCKNTGYFIYGNHTQSFSDTFITSLGVFPKRNFLIVNPVNISLKGTGTLVEMLGAIPIPNNRKATKNFMNEIEKHINKKHSITIYPEAHIWPYYTKIRPFKEVSFEYPVKLNKPSYSMTNTYQKNKNRVEMVTYIDGPFFPDENLSKKESKTKLRNEIYDHMVEKAKNSNIEVVKYIKESVLK